MPRVVSHVFFAVLIVPFCAQILPSCASKRVPTRLSKAFPIAHAIPDRQESTNSDVLPTTGRLGEYLAYALAKSPRTRAAFEDWRSARFRISKAGRLPEPTISFGYFLRSVETRLGPQRYKLGVMQTFPWPGTLRAGEEVLEERAHAAARLVDANVLAVARDVATAYWTLWLIDEEQRLTKEHDAILESLAGAVRGGLKTGTATLADLNQINLLIARHHDHLGRHDEAARRASAELRSALGAPASSSLLVTADEPLQGLPIAGDEELATMSREHPLIATSSHLAAGARKRVAVERAQRYPRFNVGLGLIGTGDAVDPTIADSGRDALVVSAGLTIPLWAGSYSDAEQAARAQERSHEATAEARLRQTEAMLASALAGIRDAQRRIDLHQSTLLPQAEATFQAVLGGYQIGRSNVASVIIAQRDLIELRLEHAKARAERAISWGELEYITGRHVSARETDNDQ